MILKEINVQQFGSATAPDGINADVETGEGTVLQVYRDWDNPQWFLYEILLGGKEVGINDIDQRFPIPGDSELSAFLEKSVDAIRDQYSPA